MKKLVIQNVQDQTGRTVSQLFGVWETNRKVMVFPFHPSKAAAEAHLAQLELDLERSKED